MASSDDTFAAQDTRRLSSTGVSTRFDNAHFLSLKQRVHSLKTEQQRLIKSEQAVKQAESAAVLELRQQHRAELQQLEEQAASLQHQLKQNTERSAKLRAQYEREKKVLQTQLDKANKTLEGIDAEHAAKMAELNSKHEAEVTQLKGQLAQAQCDFEAERATLAAEKAAAVDEVDQWCTGEVEAVRHVMRKEVEEAHVITQEWQQRFEAEAANRREAEAEAREATGRADEAAQEALKLTEQLGLSQTHCEELAGQVEAERAAAGQALDQHAAVLRAQHSEDVAALKSKHSQQLDLVAERLQSVVGRKDTAIASLKSELAAVTAKLAQFERLLGPSAASAADY